jgi:pSer/pThr/pTyr-binding forkhead associated (FHA) protein
LPNPFENGNLAWFWYELWLAGIAGGFALAMVIHARVKISAGFYRLPLQILLAIGFIGTLPLALERLGINLGGKEEVLAVLSFIGASGAAIYGVFAMRAVRLVKWVNKRIAERQAAAAEVRASRAAGSPGAATGGASGRGATSVAAASSISRNTGAGNTGAENTGNPGNTGGTSAWLHFRSGPASGQSLPLSPGVTRMGRDNSNDVVIDDPNVSRMHAEIELRNGSYFLRDAGSSGGTIFGDQKIAGEQLLSSGATIKMGNTELVFTAAESVTQFASGTVVSGAGSTDVHVRSTTVDAIRPGETMLGGAEADDDRLAAWIAITSGPLKGQICQLSADRTTIGRDSSNQLVVNDPAVSRSHAVVIARDDVLVLVDLGSAGGTKVNGRSVSGKTIPNGARLRVGDTELELISVDSSTPPAQSGNQIDQTVLDMPSANGVVVVRSGPDAGLTFNLMDGDNIIGRDRGSAVELSDPSVSRRHAIIRSQSGGYVVYDLASKTGTSVNGSKLKGARLITGDRIAIGHTELSLMRPDAA